MTTTLRSRYGKNVVIARDPHGDDLMSLEVGTGGDVLVDRAEFLAAISAELGVLIINRDDLPEVVASSDQPGVYYVNGAPFTRKADVEGLRRTAMQQLAVCEHLAADPPVDEDQVNALAKVIDSEADALDITGDWKARDLARRLVRAGVRAPEEADR